MNPSRWLWIGLLGTLVSLHGCGSSKEDEDQPSGATCPSAGTTLTYANFGSDFMSKFCLDCHSSSKTGSAREDAPVGFDFDTLDKIKALAHEIDVEAAASPSRTNTSMPPSSESAQPNSDERLKLGEWLACGSPP